MTMHRDRRRCSHPCVLALPAVASLVVACGSGGSGPQAAGADGPCFQGETVTFVVPFGPGGGYDVIARGLSPFMAEALGADAVVVQNQPGAGGLTAANQIYTADPDGLTFGLFAAQGIVGASMAGAEGAAYDPEKFTYIARVAEDSRVLSASPQSGLATIEDVVSAGPLQYATSGVGAADHVDANVLPTILGIEADIEIVTGFSGSAETELAVAGGQVEIGSGTLGTRINSIRNGDQVPVLLMGRERDELVPDVPALLELDLDDPELAEAYIGLQEVGRSVFGPPGIPDSCVAELQDAIEGTLADPEFEEQVADSVDVPFEYTDGAGLEEAVQNVLDAPDELVQLLVQAYEGQ